MDELKVRTAEIGAMAARLGRQADAIGQDLEDLAKSTALVMEGWEGDGADAYLVRQDAVRTELLKHEEKLRAARDLALALEDTYARADVELARLVGDTPPR